MTVVRFLNREKVLWFAYGNASTAPTEYLNKMGVLFISKDCVNTDNDLVDGSTNVAFGSDQALF